MHNYTLFADKIVPVTDEDIWQWIEDDYSIATPKETGRCSYNSYYIILTITIADSSSWRVTYFQKLQKYYTIRYYLQLVILIGHFNHGKISGNVWPLKMKTKIMK